MIKGSRFLTCWLVLFILWQTSANAQERQLRFKHYTAEDGLSQATIFNITQDSKGFIWFASYDGLNRFDGYNFKAFRPTDLDSNSIKGERINAAIVGRDNFLWVGTNESLNLYNGITGTFEHFYIQPKPGINLKTNYFPFFIDDKNEVWFTYNNSNLASINLSSRKITSYPFFDGAFNEYTTAGYSDSVFFKPLSTIYSCGTDGLHVIDVKKSKVEFYFSGNTNNRIASKTLIRQLLVDTAHSLWLSTKNGLVNFNTSTLETVLYNRINYKSQQLEELSSLVKDKQGNIWCGSYGMGLSLFNTNKKKFVENYSKNPSDRENISNNAVTALFIDKEENLWIGIDLEGVDKASPGFEQLFHVQLKPDGESSNYTSSVWSIGEIDSASLLICSNHQDLILYDQLKGRCRKYHLPGIYTGSTIYNTFPDSHKRIWIGSDKGLFYSDDKLKTVKLLFRKEFLDDVYFYECSNRLFVGTGNNLFVVQLNKSSPVIDSIPFLAGRRISCINQLPDGLLCVTTSNKEMFLINIDSGNYSVRTRKEFDFLIKTISFNVGVDTVWFGTTTGLVRYIISKDAVKTFSEKDGLANNFIYCLLRGNDGAFWMSTNKGISKFEPSTGGFSNFGFEEGVQSLEFNSHSFFHAAHGTIYFGGVKGYNYFMPSAIKENDFKPRIELLSLTVNGKSISMKDFFETGKRVIFSSNENNISIEFAAIDFNRNNHINYLYRLNGSSSWILAGKNRSLSFANLPAGNYSLEVKAQYSYNVTSPYVLQIPFTILPPFYKTAWFVCLLLIATALVVYGFYRYRINQLLKIQSIRNSIARDLHDEVGATLSGISMYIHLTKEQIGHADKEGVEKSLNIIQQNAGEMVNKLNDIVWLINPDHDSLEQLMQRLEDYAVQIAVAKGIQVRSSIKKYNSKRILPPQTRRNIYLIFKEGINNAVKYSGASILELHVNEQNATMEISLKDNGDGFDVERVIRGNGLKNMEERAKEIKANCIIESEKQRGTFINLMISLP